MRLVLTSDHAGYELREALAEHGRSLGHEVLVVGAPSPAAYDYPDAADEGAAVLLAGKADFGVFICGSGVGICIRANRHKGIRGAPCTTVESARLARDHNDANVLCLGQRTTTLELAAQIMEAFIAAPTSPEERHKRRVLKLDGNV
jgi:ribose 5-phosphate isomerase B